MNRDKKEPDYPVELESQFILRLPEEPAKVLREVLQTGENFKNRLTIQLENDMRHGEVRFDNWLLHAKVVDLPTLIESTKTIDRKSIYKTADICQMLVCKDELDPTPEEESPSKNKKKDPLKVDKKYLWPHGITPPTKNVRKKRFRKTLKKKSVEAPEIEKEVKRLLRADNEAVSVTWEVVMEEEENKDKNDAAPTKAEKAKTKKSSNVKLDMDATNQSSSKVEDIFGGAVSDSDLEDENVDIEDSRIHSFDDHLSDSNSVQGTGDYKASRLVTQFRPEMFTPQPSGSGVDISLKIDSTNMYKYEEKYLMGEFTQPSSDSSSLAMKLQKISSELEELKQRKLRTQQEISGMENMTLRQRFQDILQNINQDIMYKELEYQKLQTRLK